MTLDLALRRLLQVKGARGAAILDVARRRVVEQAGEPTPILHLPARREALCRSIEAQIEAASLLREGALCECLLVLDGAYFVAHPLAAPPGQLLCLWLEAEQGNLGIALRLIASASAGSPSD